MLATILPDSYHQKTWQWGWEGREDRMNTCITNISCNIRIFLSCNIKTMGQLLARLVPIVTEFN